MLANTNSRLDDISRNLFHCELHDEVKEGAQPEALPVEWSGMGRDLASVGEAQAMADAG